MAEGAFIKMPRAILERTDLTATAKLVYAIILDRIGSNGESWPGVRKIARDIGCCRNSALAAMLDLEKLGVLEVCRPTGNPSGRSNRYRTRKWDVPENGTYQNMDGGRTRKWDGDVPENGTEPDPLNQTHITRPSRGDTCEPDVEQKPKKPKIDFAPETGWRNIAPEDLKSWRKAYPAVDVDGQLLRMGEWCKANGARGHKSNWRRFITNWLSRTQDRGGDANVADIPDLSPSRLPEPDPLKQRIDPQMERVVQEFFRERSTTYRPGTDATLSQPDVRPGGPADNNGDAGGGDPQG